MDKKIRTRFAPSPTGYLHIGGLRTALYNYLFAKKYNGDFILRIEDTDQKRYVENSIDLIYQTLKASGIIYDEGPDIGGKYGPYVQSKRKDIYLEYAKKLINLNGAYYCFCTQDRLDKLKNEYNVLRYDKHCLNLTQEEIKTNLENNIPYVIRQNVPTQGTSTYYDEVFGEITINFKDIEDGILIKNDGMPTYNFANVIDDHLMDITHIIRGTEYLTSTPKYNLIYDTFGWERPTYIHVQPIMKDSQHKLSKRNGDASYSDFINKGYLNETIINYIALLGWKPSNNIEKMTLNEMINLFDINGIHKTPAIFDENKMKWLNSLYIKELEKEKFINLAQKYIHKIDENNVTKICNIVQNRIFLFSEIQDKIQFINGINNYNEELYINKKQHSNIELAKKILPKIYEELLNLNIWDNTNIFNSLVNLSNIINENKNALLYITRIALTGLSITAGGASEIADILGKKESLNRLLFSMNNILHINI